MLRRNCVRHLHDPTAALRSAAQRPTGSRTLDATRRAVATPAVALPSPAASNVGAVAVALRSKADAARRALAVLSPTAGTGMPWSDAFEVRDGHILQKKRGGKRGLKPPESKEKKEKEKEKEEKKGGGDGDEDDEEDDDGFNNDIERYTSWVTRTVIGITVAAGVLYYLSLPSGPQVTWEQLEQRADDIVAIDLYHRYAQVTLSDGSAYVGLPPSMADVETRLRAILATRKPRPKQKPEADAAAPQPDAPAPDAAAAEAEVDSNSADATAATANAEAAPTMVVTLPEAEELEPAPAVPIPFHGVSHSERALEVLGVVAWVVPFVFTPLYLTMLSYATSTLLRDSLRVMSKQASGDKTKKSDMFKVAKTTSTRFGDIAGMTEAKGEIIEVVDFLRHPDRYKELGARIPSGAMLLGPPGTGKTLLAKAVAGEAGVPFIACCGSDFVELYVGMGALRVRQLFELAKQQPKCIIYIDEIDAIGMKRGGGGNGEAQEQEHTLNELLTQLDGFNTVDEKIILLGSSNVPQDQLDPALIRPGRFDRIVHIDAPIIQERVDIFKVHLDKLRLVEPPAEPVLPAADEVVETEVQLEGDKAEKKPDQAADKEEAKEEAKEEVKGTDKSEAPKGDATAEAKAEATDAAKTEPKTEAAQPTPTEDTKTEAVKPEEVKEEAKADAKVEAKVDAKVEEAKTDAKTDAAKDEAKAEATTEEAKVDAKVDAKVEAKAGEEIKPEEVQEQPPATEQEKYQAERAALMEDIAKRMSNLCPGFVGADIANVCNEGAILAAREEAPLVTLGHLERSIDRVLAGIEHRGRVLSPFEKKVVAHHEAGHAVAGWYLGRADPLMKVSIVPRGGSALGYAQYLPNESKQRCADDIIDSICVTLGGRVAESIFFDHWSTGASDDLRKVTRYAYSHVTSFNRSTVYPAPGTEATAYAKPYGETTGDELDAAAKALVDRAYTRTYDLLLSKKTEMAKLAEHLLEHEMLTHDDVVRFLGERPPRPSDRKRA